MKRTLRVHIQPWGELCLQYFKWNSKRILLSPFRKSRGGRIWQYSSHLLKCGVPLLEPVLFLEIKQAFLVTRTFIATPWLDDKTDLGTLVLSGDPLSTQLQKAVSKAVDAVATLHEAGFLHRDLKWSNFLCLSRDPSKPILTDLDGLRKSRSVFLQGKDFARFVVSAGNCPVGKAKEDELIGRYLDKRNCPRGLLESSIRWHVRRRRGSRGDKGSAG